MHLISCDGCASVFDANKLSFPAEEWNPDKRDERNFGWCDERGTLVPKIPCPLCKSDILKP